MNWLPIETAPKDGTWILLKGGSVDTDGYNVEVVGPMNPAVVAFWQDREYEKQAWVYGFWDGAWYSDYQNPTHWMPIPA